MERLGLLVEPAMLPITIIPKHEGIPPLLHEEGWRGVEEKGSRRGLQTSCAEGDPFAITSSAFPSLEGCVLYSGFETADGNLVYNSSSAIILSISSSTTTTDGSAEAFWVVYEILEDDSFDFHCFSNETSTALPYPVEATWICDVDGDGVVEFPTSSEFSTSCDCSTTTATTTDINTGTTTTTDIGTGTSTTTDIGSGTSTTTDIGSGTTTTSCAEGSPFTITSSAFPLMEGCVLYSGFATADGNLVYNSSSAIILSISFSTTTTDGSAEAFWVVYEILEDDSSDFHCFSNETSTALPYPVEATWICDVDGDGVVEFPTSSEFSTSCDCSTTTATTTDINTGTTTTTDIGTGTSTTTDIGSGTSTTTDIGSGTTTTSCAEGAPFTITSSAFPLMEGCVLYSGFETADGNLVYNSSSAIILSISSSTTTTDGSAETFWVVYEILDDDSSDFRCISNETSTALPYPVEATWICDVDGDSVIELPTSSEFSTSCDCSTTTVTTTDIGTETTTTTDIGTDTTTTTDTGTDTTTTTDSGTETSTTTDSDTETTTTTNIGTGTTTTTTDTTIYATCNEGESFTITSTVVPEVVGCYSDTGTLNENEVIYTETGTTDDGQNVVAAVNIGEDSAQDVRWLVGYSSLDTTSRENEIYCISTELAANVHPVDVTSWTCDLSDGGSETSDIFLLSDTDFSVTCGCASGITSSSSTTPGSEQNANVGHLSTTLSTFVAVGVGFTATVVHLVRL